MPGDLPTELTSGSRTPTPELYGAATETVGSEDVLLTQNMGDLQVPEDLKFSFRRSWAKELKTRTDHRDWLLNNQTSLHRVTKLRLGKEKVTELALKSARARGIQVNDKKELSPSVNSARFHSQLGQASNFSEDLASRLEERHRKAPQMMIVHCERAQERKAKEYARHSNDGFSGNAAGDLVALYKGIDAPKGIAKIVLASPHPKNNTTRASSCNPTLLGREPAPWRTKGRKCNMLPQDSKEKFLTRMDYKKEPQATRRRHDPIYDPIQHKHRSTSSGSGDADFLINQSLITSGRRRLPAKLSEIGAILCGS